MNMCKESNEKVKGSNPSFTWSSVFTTQGLIKNGALLCVGSGSLIKFFFDPWLLDKDNLKVKTIPPLNLKNIPDISLKGAYSLSWDMDLLLDLYFL
ncbi:hypothetical protein LguiA_033528 [Lonicera macranthoides]